MNKLIAELTRLYLPPGAMSAPALEQQLRAVSLANGDSQARAMVIPFVKTDIEGEHWTILCEVANAVQAELGLPAPAVSISGDDGYALWLSLERAVPTSVIQQFLGLLRQAYFPGMELRADAATAPVELPPCLHQSSGKWSAFINPGLGASFTDEAGLEMAPPIAGQAALLESVQSIGAAQFQRAMTMLQQAHGGAAGAGESAPVPVNGLLLMDATLEDIVRHLHAKHIEPTFRHLMRRP
ncbi:hypothetical protein [Massilia sp. TWR1-2-2]|uniref:hypothetical protein n=1 Tax=Massilia sp. TWR1-2-2 TaxID=2804584 RepID=UPI003CF5F2A0